MVVVVVVVVVVVENWWASCLSVSVVRVFEIHCLFSPSPSPPFYDFWRLQCSVLRSSFFEEEEEEEEKVERNRLQRLQRQLQLLLPYTRLNRRSLYSNTD